MAATLGLDPDAVLDLSQTLNPVAPDPVRVLRRHLAAVRRYPDPTRASEALAGAMGVDSRRLLLTNGGAQAIALVAAALGGGRVEEPEFSLHPRGGGPRWRSNPHNPSGVLAPSDESADVWDEAFYPLATGSWTRGDAGAVVVGSLTKLFACPGLRLGYVLAPPDMQWVIDRCRQQQTAWSVNGLALDALPDLLTPVDLPRWARRVAGLRDELVSLLGRHGLGATVTAAPWVLVARPGLRRDLARRGVVVRDCTSFGMPGVFRIAVPGLRGLERLDRALGSLPCVCPAPETRAGAATPPARPTPAPPPMR